jgi:arylsulfatase A
MIARYINLMPVIWILVIPVLNGCGPSKSEAPDHNDRNELPNLIIILTDDLGYQDMGCFGSSDILTPNLDRIAEEGIRFTDFYAAASTCTPSRAAILTGCYPKRVSLTKPLRPYSKIGINPNEITLAELLINQGYATAYIGKWHLGHRKPFLPTRHGFDYFFGLPYSNDMNSTSGKDRTVAQLNEAWRLGAKASRWWDVPLLRNDSIVERPVDQTRLTELYTDEAIEFIKANQNQPFFLYLAHSMPHVPLFVPASRYIDDPKQAYKITVEHLDDCIGRVLDQLSKLHLDDRTLIIFFSDNGPWTEKRHFSGNAYPLRGGKNTTFEGGFRVPCLMRWPGHIPARQVCPELVTAMDLYPTFAQLAGARIPDDRMIDGKNILALMKSNKDARSPHEAFFYYDDRYLGAVRCGDWKLRRRNKGRFALYNLSKDISERVNLAGRYPAWSVELLERMNQFDRSLKNNTRPPGRW